MPLWRIQIRLAGAIDPAQTLTTTFKLCNVDVARRKTIGKKEFHALMAAAAESGQYALPRKEGSDHITPVDHMTATIMTRLPSYYKEREALVNATDPELLSQAEMEGRKQAIEYIRFLRDKVPGYEKAQLSTFGMQIGVRETRRVYGEYRLTKDEVLSAKQFDDQYGLYAPEKTSAYSFGGAELFPTDNYGPEVNGPEDFPMPKTPAASAALINRTGAWLRDVFTEAHRLGMKTCVGTESPLEIPAVAVKPENNK